MNNQNYKVPYLRSDDRVQEISFGFNNDPDSTSKEFALRIQQDIDGDTRLVANVPFQASSVQYSSDSRIKVSYCFKTFSDVMMILCIILLIFLLILMQYNRKILYHPILMTFFKEYRTSISGNMSTQMSGDL